MDILLFLSQNGLALGVAVLTAALVARDSPAWHRMLVVCVVYGVLAEMSILLVGISGYLTPRAVLGLLVTLAMAFLIFGAPRVLKQNASVVGEGNGRSGRIPANLRFGEILGLALLVTALVPPVVRLVVGGPRFGWDDYSYHAAFPAQWLVDGGIGIAPLNYHVYYPFNAELLSLWFMLPFRNDSLVGLSGAYWLGVLAIASYAFLRHLAIPGRIAALGSALTLASPVIVSSAYRFSASDLAGPVALLAAVALLIRPGDEESSAWNRADLVMAGLMGGLAAGTKAFFIPGTGVLLIWILMARRASLTLRQRLIAGGLFGGAALATGSYWYIRNIISTGNPFFPADVGPFAGPFLAEHQWQTRLIRWFVEYPFDLDIWRDGLAGLTDWPVPLAIVSTIGIIRVAKLLASRVHGEDRDTARALIPLLLVAAVLFVMSFIVPFSGTFNAPGAPFAPEPRFLAFSLLGGLLMYCATLRRQRKPSLMEYLALAVLVSVLLMERLAISLAFAAAVLVMLYGARILGPYITSIGGWRTLGIMLAIGTIVALVVLRPSIERRLEDRVFSYRRGAMPLGAAWSQLEQLPAGTKVAAFGPAADQLYPLFGRHLVLHPVPFAPSGQKLKTLYTLWKENPAAVQWWGEVPEPDSLTLLQSLREDRIGVVLISKESDSLGSPYERFLHSVDGVEVMYDDGYCSLWKLPPEE